MTDKAYLSDVTGQSQTRDDGGESDRPVTPRRRPPASDFEQERRRRWGQFWGQAGRNAGIAAKRED